MNLAALLEKKKKASQRKESKPQVSEKDRLKYGLSLFGGLGQVAGPEETEQEGTTSPQPVVDAAAHAQPESAPSQSEVTDAACAPTPSAPAEPDAKRVNTFSPVNLAPVIPVITSAAKKVKTWDEVKIEVPKTESESNAAAAEAAKESKPEKFVARGRQSATGALTAAGLAKPYSVENLPTLEEAFAPAKPKASSPASPVPEGDTPSPLSPAPSPVQVNSPVAHPTTGAYKPPATSSAGAYVAPSRVAQDAKGNDAVSKPTTAAYKPPATSSAGAYKPPATSSAGAYKPPATSSAGAYKPPVRPAGDKEGDTINKPAATTAAYKPPESSSAGAYKPPASSSAGAYKPPATSSAGAYKPPSRPAGDTEGDAAAKPTATTTNTYKPPESSSAGAYKPPASSGAYKPLFSSPGAYKPPTSSGAYKPPSRPAGDTEGDASTKPAATTTNAYKPPASSTAGAYKPPGSSSAGAYKPPSKR